MCCNLFRALVILGEGLARLEKPYDVDCNEICYRLVWVDEMK